MNLIEEILSNENLNEAIKRVKANKGASGTDKMTTDMLEPYFYEHRKEIIESIMNKTSTRKKSIYSEIQWQIKTSRNTNGG